MTPAYSAAMNQRARILTISLLACLSLSVQAQPLRVVSEAWPPYIYEEDGELRGLDYDAARIILQRLGVDAEWQLLPWKRCILALKQEQADAILGIHRTQERESTMLFPSEPLSQVELVLFYAKNRPYSFRHLDDLQGLKVGVSSRYWYSNQAFRESELFIREHAPNHAANFGKLVRERVQLVLNDRYAGRFLLDRMDLNDAIDHHPQVISRDPLYLGLRRGAGLDSLAEDFADELRRFKHELAYARLASQYGVVPTQHLATYARPRTEHPGAWQNWRSSTGQAPYAR